MFIASVLAVALVLSLTAAVSYLPLSPQAAPKTQLSTASAPTPSSTLEPKSTLPSYSAGASSTQMPPPAPAPTAPPISAPTAAPTTAPAAVSAQINYLPVLFVIVAVVIGLLAVQVLFREKELKKELNSEGE